MKYLLIILIAMVLVCGGAICINKLFQKIRFVSTSLWGTQSFAEGIRKQQQELSGTPKSVAGMTAVYEPLILKDFPEFNWKEYQTKAEQALVSAFCAITENDMTFLAEASYDLRKQVQARLEANRLEDIREVYRQIQIHKTVIADYEKKSGMCIVTLQSAVGHIHYRERNGELLQGRRDLKEQTKYNIQLMYVQDSAIANQDHAVGVNCPNCGAPITNLGNRKCEYCKTPVIPVNMQAWSIHSFNEVCSQNI